jgi:hypothetical protein
VRKGARKMLQAALEAEIVFNRPKPEEIIVDFQKLLICKADIKLLIFQDNADLLPYLRKSIKLCNDPVKTYLIAQYENDKHVFNFTQI